MSIPHCCSLSDCEPGGAIVKASPGSSIDHSKLESLRSAIAKELQLQTRSLSVIRAAAIELLSSTIRCGRLLAQTRSLVERNGWERWVNANLEISKHHANRLIALSQHFNHCGDEQSLHDALDATGAVSTDSLLRHFGHRESLESSRAKYAERTAPKRLCALNRANGSAPLATEPKPSGPSTQPRPPKEASLTTDQTTDSFTELLRSLDYLTRVEPEHLPAVRRHLLIGRLLAVHDWFHTHRSALVT